MIDVDGITGYVDFPFPAVAGNIASNDLSVCVWVTFDTVSTTFARVIDISNNTSNYVQLIIGQNSGELTALVRDAGVTNSIRVNSLITTGVKYHVVITWNAGSNNLDFYLDGVSQTTAGFTTITTNTTNQFNLGRRTDGTNYSNVQVEDLRIYSKFLSIEEVSHIHTGRGLDGIFEKLDNRWPMNDQPDGTPCGGATGFIDSTQSQINSTFLNVTVPTVSTGNLMVAAISTEGANSTGAVVSTPAGWTLMSNGQPPPITSRPSLYHFRRTASSSEPSTYAFIINQTCMILGIMATYDHTIIDTIPEEISSVDSGTSSLAVSPSVSPTASSLVIGTSCCDAQVLPSPVSNFYPPGSNGREALEAIAVGNGVTAGLTDQLVPPGATGSATWSLSASTGWCASTIAFNTAGGGAPDTDCVKDLRNSKENGVPNGATIFVESELVYRRNSIG